MKKKLLFIQLLISICLTACYTNVITDHDGEGDGDDPNNSSITLTDPTQLNQSVSADSPSCEVTFTTTTDWNSYILTPEAQPWVTLTPASGEYAGEYTLQILFSENTTGTSRSVQIELNCGGQTQNINITQEATRKDGSYPEAYEPDVFETMVEQIQITELTDGIENKDFWREIRIHYDEDQVQYIEKLNIAKEEADNYVPFESIHMNFIPEEYKMIYEHDFLGDHSEVTQKNYHECILNEQRHIKEAQITNYSFLHEREEEHPQKPNVIIYSYKNFRLQEQKSDYDQTRYIWNDQDMTEIQQKYSTDEEYTTLQTLTYTHEENNKANLDLNQVLLDDIMAMVGFYGKRSQHLLSSIADYKGGKSEFTYTFNAWGYVKTITVTRSFEGVEEPTKQVYTIQYKE